MSEQRISDERLAELADLHEFNGKASPWPRSQKAGADTATALRELAALRKSHREIICRQCGHREQLGEVPNADF